MGTFSGLKSFLYSTVGSNEKIPLKDILISTMVLLIFAVACKESKTEQINMTQKSRT